MTPKRIEFTLPFEMWDRIEKVRGDVPRAAWIKRAVEARLAECPHEWFPIVGSESATQCKLCGKAGVDWDKRNALAAAEFERVIGGALESALGGAEEPVHVSGRAASAPARAPEQFRTGTTPSRLIEPVKSDLDRVNEIERAIGSSVKDPRAALPPGVKTAAELMRERQERLNKGSVSRKGKGS